MPVRALLVQTAMDDYRQAFVDEILASTEPTVEILVGESHFKETVRTRLQPHPRLQAVTNVYLFRRRLAWQRGVQRSALRADVTVLELNPRILSNWPVLLLRRLLNRRTLLWGHGWSRSGPGSRTEVFRAAMRRFAGTTLVYTRTDAEELRARYPQLNVRPMINAMASAEQMGFTRPVGNGVVYSGRLVAEKKPELLIRGFAEVLGDLPPDSELLIAGDGPMRSNLEQLSDELGLRGRVTFLGRCVGQDLRETYTRARVAVSPGYAGLSLIQSLGFGRPMLIADQEPHAPEIEAAIPEVNCRYFEANSPRSLGQGLVGFFREAERWGEAGSSIAESCQRNYSVEQMVDQFLGALKHW